MQRGIESVLGTISSQDPSPTIPTLERKKRKGNIRRLKGSKQHRPASVGKPNLLSDHFYSKQPKKSVDSSVACHPSPSLITLAFKSSKVARLLLDILCMFPIFMKRIIDVLVPFLIVVFRLQLAGDRPMSPQFRKVHRSPLLSITD